MQTELYGNINLYRQFLKFLASKDLPSRLYLSYIGDRLVCNVKEHANSEFKSMIPEFLESSFNIFSDPDIETDISINHFESMGC